MHRCVNVLDMKREQFLSSLRKFCRKNDLPLEIDQRHGKGSHYTVRVAGSRTTVKSGDLARKEVQTMLKQLGLPPNALE